MNTIKGKLKNIVVNSELTEQDKKLWEEFIKVSEEEALIEIIKFLESEPEKLEFFTNNLKGKLDAFINRDRDKLNDIIKAENEVIDNL